MERRWVRTLFYSLLAKGLGISTAFASPTSLTYQGRIMGANGAPLQYSSVSFQFEITNSSGTCVIYREQVNGINMANSNGIFDVKIGASHSYPASGTFTILDSFNNSTPFTCDGGVVYNPSVGDGRKLRVQFYDGTAWRLISPDSVIGSVPYAAYSESASKIGTHEAAEFILKTEVNGNATCSGGSFLTWNAATQTFGCAAGSAGSGTVTDITSANSYISIANSTTTPVLTLNVGSGANTVAAGNDARLSNARTPTGAAAGDLGGSYPNPSVTKIQGVGIDFAVAPTLNQVLTFDGTNWIPQDLPTTTSGTVTSIATGTGLTGGPITSTGTIGLSAALQGLHGVATNGYIQRTGAGTYSVTTGSAATASNTLVLRDGSGVSSFAGIGFSGSTSGAITFQAPTITGNYSLTFPNAQGGANQVLSNNGSGLLNWVSVPAAPASDCGAGSVLTYSSGAFTCVPDQVGASGGGITSLAGQSGSSQSFGIGTTGNAPGWSSGSDIHTLHIPMASTASVTAGLISKAEYDSFAGKQAALGFTPLNPANNLNDVASASSARTNLGLGTAALKDVAASGNAASSEVVMGDDTRLTNSRAPTGTAGGDLGGTYPNPDVNKIKGVSLSMTSLTSGNYLKYNGTNWVNSAIAIADVTGLSTSLSGKIDQSQISGTCTAASTLTFSSVTGTWTCSDIAIAGTQVTYAAQTAKTFFSAPTGAAGAPSFRTIASTDLPSSITDALWTGSSGNVYRSSGSVGIGTTSPLSTLDVRGNITIPYNVQVSSNATTHNNLTLMSNAWNAGVSSDELTIAPVGNSQSRITFKTASGTAGSTTLSPVMSLLPDGNVGIGMTSPTAPLQVRRTTAQSDGIIAAFQIEHATDAPMVGFYGYTIDNANTYLRDTVMLYSTNSTPNLQLTASATDGVIRFHTAGFNSAASERMRIDSVGYVGIGTTTPTANLHVAKSTASGGVETKIENLSATSASALVRTKNQSRNWAAGVRGDTSNIYAIQDDTAGAVRLAINSSGYVGVGTTNPSYHVDARGAIGSTHASGNSLFLESMDGSLGFGSRLRYGGSGTNADVFQIQGTSGLIKMHIADNGHIAIGSASPKTSLDIYTGTTNNGHGLVLRQGGGNSGRLYFEDDTGTDSNVIVRTADSLKITTGGTAGTNSGTSRITLLDSGNVGIGTTAPAYLLHVNGTAGKTGGGSWTDSSDRRLKRNIASMPEGALDKLMELRPVTYEWIHPKAHLPGLQTGFIAQEVEQVFPNWVSENPVPKGDEKLIPRGEKSKSLSFPHDFNAYIVKAVQELVTWLSGQEERIDKLEAENKMMKEYLCAKDPQAPFCAQK